jgi:hypothetical protein
VNYFFLNIRRWAKLAIRISPPLFISLAGLGFLQCSADLGTPGGPTYAGDGDVADLDTNRLDLRGMGGAEGGVAQGINSLCGVGSCLPDDPDACTAEAMGGAAGGPGELLGGAAGSVSFDPGDLGGVAIGCRVELTRDCEGVSCPISRSCQSAGAGEESDPCVSSGDCRAGLACVGEGVSGVCRPYCCAGSANSCATGTFCDERPLPESPQHSVPVCLPVDGCTLTESFPCLDGESCACKGERACIVVRSDGATACAVPGPGQLGDPCTGAEAAECAHGFVCSPSAGCMKLCSTVAPISECPAGGTCQTPSEFPANLGVCVGAVGGSPVTK